VLGLPSLKSGARYSIKRIGDIREPWGSPHWISIRGPIESSSRIQTVRPVAKEATQLTRFDGQPCSRSRLTSRPGRTASKAPLTSRVRREAVCRLYSASSMLCVRQVVRSTAERRGRAPNCWLARTLCVIAIQAILRANNRSSPLPSTASSAMGL